MRLCHNPFTYNKRTKTDKMKLLFLEYEYNLSELNDNESVYTFNLKQSLLKNKYHHNYYNIVKLSITSSFVKRISTLRDVLVKWKKENMATYALVSSSTHVLVGSNTENLLTKLTQSRSVIVSSSLDDEFVAFGKLNDVVQLLDGILSHLKKHKESTVLDSVNAISTHVGNIHLDHSQDVIGHATTSNNDQHNIHHDMNWIMKTEETQDELGGGGLGRGYCLLFRYRNQECNSFSHPDVLLFSSSSSSSNKKGYNFLVSKYLSAAPASNKFSTLYKRNSIRLVASLTSLPHRLENIDDTLNSLVSQHVKPDVIYLNIPKSYLRFGALPNLSTIARLRKKFSNKYGVSFVINMMEDDVGPLSKLLPTLYKEVDDDTLIITVDDDMIFKPTLFGILLQQHLNSPSMAYGVSGQLIDIDDDNSVHVRTAWKWKDGSYPVDIIEGFTGAIYRRDFFDIDNVSEIPHVCRFTDDIWISSQLALKGIPRVKLALGWVS